MLVLKEISKLYTPTSGISEITISIPHGKTVSFIGPNGAGKTTLFNILGRISKADTGTCSLDGVEIDSLHISEISYLPQNMYLIEDFTPMQMIYFFNTMKEINTVDADIHELICRLGIEPFMYKKIRKLSSGMRKRVELACSMLGNPKLLVLDEPLNALDIQGSLVFKDMLKDWNRRGAIVLLSSPILGFLDSCVDQVVFLKQGKILEVYSNENTSNVPEQIENLYRRHFAL
ncbi:MAG: ABC transporter ATP-binding protein [Oscillospiraceae bacterium]|jgi:ABC-type multidrug transport system ATPase subunit|nr:ABC transporter ATP-binding protein [Oscillospiraceae bacterium]